MSHVISSQPSSTSPYQPTEIQEQNGHNQPRVNSIMETRQDRDDCCFRADKSQGCFAYYCCNFLSSICGGIRDCSEKCCNCCANCLADCCEDKPDDKKKRRRYRNTGSEADYDDYDDNTWVVGAIQHHNTAMGSDEPPELGTVKYESSIQHSQRHDLDNVGHHPSSGQDSRGHHSSGHHDSGTHHSSSHDSGVHHSSSHDSGTHHSSSHDSGGHHSSSHDSGGGTCDSGGGGYDGGGDSGGGCDSGGGGGDSGGGGCDD